MILRTLIIGTSLCLSFVAFSQIQYKQATINLSPIVRDNGRYYYEGKRLTFESILIPLYSLNDQAINKDLKNYQTIGDIRSVIYSATSLYLFYDIASHNGKGFNIQRDINFMFGSLIVTDLLRIARGIIKRRVVNRYNDLVLQPTGYLGPNRTLGMGFKLRF